MPKRYNHLQSLLLLVGRLAFVTMYFIAGYEVAADFQQYAALMTERGVPVSQFFLILGFVAEFGGALLVLFGWYTRWGAFLLLIFTLAITLIFHSFWTYTGSASIDSKNQFFLNLNIMGGTLFLMVTGAGRYGIDYFRHKNKSLNP